jgi:hypothetical protein
VLREAELAVVVEGSHFDVRRRKVHRKVHHVLARVEDPAAVAELRCALRCVPGTSRMDWMTPGQPTVAPFASGRSTSLPSLSFAPGWVRSEGLLNGDVLLAEPGRLITWLGSAGG